MFACLVAVSSNLVDDPYKSNLTRSGIKAPSMESILLWSSIRRQKNQLLHDIAQNNQFLQNIALEKKEMKKNNYNGDNGQKKKPKGLRQWEPW